MTSPTTPTTPATPPTPRSIIDGPPGPLGHGTVAEPRLVIESWLGVPVEGVGWRCLLLRRTPAGGGFWQGVSGSVESYDVSLRAAALREIAEETGVATGVEIVDLGRFIDFRGLISKAWFRKRCLGAVLPRGTSPATVTLSDEHDTVELLTFTEAKARLRFPENVRELAQWEEMLLRRG